jgi:N6-L-threonylcarbamoyladenine synthase
MFEEANLPLKDGLPQIDGVACTNGPGLIGTLLVGLSTAKALAWALDVPLLAVDHIQAHVCANYIDTDSRASFCCSCGQWWAHSDHAFRVLPQSYHTRANP